VRPNLTITFGIRHTILQTPYEENGQQVAPQSIRMRGTSSGHCRGAGAGLRTASPIRPSGPANHAPGLWSKQKTNFAPRLAIAYSPNEKTSIRAGFGLYFDHYGEGIVNTFDQFGSFGLNTSVESPAEVYTFFECTPLQPVSTVSPNGSPQPSPITYPYTTHPAPLRSLGVPITI